MTTKIQWTDATWNPVTGCTRVSAGCDHCYAVAMTRRLAGMGQTKYQGLVNDRKGHFNGVVKCHDDALKIPLRWRKPRRVFVNSMSDLFHPGVPFEFIDKVFAVMALCPQHTFQVLTKRPERMAEYLCDQFRMVSVMACCPSRQPGIHVQDWPLPNVWLGTSVEDQESADERIPHLLRCPAAVRFLSCEPLLARVDLSFYGILKGCDFCCNRDRCPGPPECDRQYRPECTHCNGTAKCHVDWVIVGGESGPGARPCDIGWIRSIRDQCQAAGVPVFIKQLGANPEDAVQWGPPLRCPKCGNVEWDIQHYDCLGADEGKLFCNACSCEVDPIESLKSTKGGDQSEWPKDLRVREWPAVAPVEVE